MTATAAVIIGAGMAGAFMLGLLLGINAAEELEDPHLPCPYCGSNAEDHHATHR